MVKKGVEPRLLSLLALIFAIGTWAFPSGAYFNIYRNFLALLTILYFIFDFYLIDYEYKKALQELRRQGNAAQ